MKTTQFDINNNEGSKTTTKTFNELTTMIALKNDQDDYNLTGGTTRVPINMKFNTLRSKLIRHILHKYANYGHFKDFK